MRKEQVNVVQAHILEAMIKAELDILGRGELTPEFRGDEDFRPRNSGFTNGCTNRLVDLSESLGQHEARGR